MSQTISLERTADYLGLSFSELVRRVHEGSLPYPDAQAAYSLERYRLIHLAYREHRPKLPKSCLTVAVANQKGGVGKTTVAINLAAELAVLGRRTLVVDMDPQGNCAQALGMDAKALEGPTLADALLGKKDVVAALRFREYRRLPRRPQRPIAFLAGGEPLGLIAETIRSSFPLERLRTLLRQLADGFDFILIDTRPDIAGFHTLSALLAAQAALIVSSPEAFSVRGLMELAGKLHEILRPRSAGGWGHDLTLLGVALNHVRQRTRNHRDHTAALRALLPGRVFETAIPQATALGQAAAHGAPIGLAAPMSKPAKAFQALAGEFLERARHERG